jgi:murein DD-endopeptidase MepM/ murein hydrolase activator NlpD
MNLKNFAISVAFFGILITALSVRIPPQSDKVVAAIQNVDQAAHEKFHYWVIDGIQVKAVPYLTLPFRKADLQKNPFNKNELYIIREGWTYSKEELAITHADPLHGGLDFDVPYGTPVVAPADGYAMASYHTAPQKDENGDQVMYKDKPINMGYGYFVRMYIPSVNRFVMLAHLSEIDPKIPFSPAEKEDDKWMPTNSKMPVEEWKTSPHAVFIKKGTVVGKVGYSGLTWGYDEYTEGQDKPVTLDKNKYKSWDEPHLHFEDQWVNSETGEVGWQRDPLAIYNTAENYPSSKKYMPPGKDPLFFFNKDKFPKYADED